MDTEDGAAATSDAPSTLRLSSDKLSPAGAQLGLRQGDVLVAVNGKPFAGNGPALQERFKQAAGRPLALTFRRRNIDVTVLADHANLGRWDVVPAVLDWEGERQDPDTLRNWEIYRDEDGRYDLQPTQPNMLVMLCPPLWLMQYRLWVPAMAITAAIAVSAAIWIVLVPFVWVMSGMILKRSGPTLFRVDRASRGLAHYAIVAAGSEAGAHAAYGKIEPKGQFIFGPERPPVSDETEI